MTRAAQRVATALAIALTALPAGCTSDPTAGYVAGSTWPADVQTVAVPIFENGTRFRDVEFDLTDAIIKEIESRTPYKVTAQSRADTILLGRITGAKLDQLSRSPVTGLGEEVMFGVTIDFEWRDLRRDESLVERREFSGHGLFDPSKPTGERIELGRMAVVQQLAADVVDEMRGSW